MFDEMARHGVHGLGKRLRERREALKLSQAEVAELMGGKASLEQVSHYEHDRRSPAAAAIVDLARALRCSTDYLLGVSGKVDPEGSRRERTPFPLQDMGRPLTPLPEKVERPSTIDEALALAKAQGKTWHVHNGRSYRLRKDGWEPV